MSRDNDKSKVLVGRTLVWVGVQLVLLAVIVLRLYYLQVYQADRFKTLAEDNRISMRLLIPPRGMILDRNQEIIAGNRQNFQAMIIAEQTNNIQETLDAFKQIIPLSEAEEERIKKDLRRYRRFVPIRLKEGLSWEDVSSILLASSDMPGVVIDEGLSRHYPYGKQMAHILGYVSAVSERDIARDADPLLGMPGFKIGKDGIEKMFDRKLRGKGGNLKLEVNALGRVMKEIERVDGIAGERMDLTIDVRLQQKAFELFGEESGAAVLLDVNTGEILAFVSTPAYDSNHFVDGISNEIYRGLLADEKSPLMNKATAGQYSPGSTFKMIVALAALEAGVITKDSRVSCQSKMRLGSHFFHCWKKEGHGALNVVEALQHSCDIFFYEIAQRLGIERISAMARRFGLGDVTDVGFDSEKTGLIPDRSWKVKRFKEPWHPGETLIAGIGQGYVLTTPLQLAVMTATIANGGYQVRPTFIPQDREALENRSNLGIRQNYMDIIRDGMCAVVNKPGGTAYASRFNYNGQQMCGKTGTTQVRRISMKERQTGILKEDQLPWKFRNHALFVGYAPHDNPRYAVAVLVEHGGGGSAVAAPIASKLLLEVLKLDEENK